MQRFTLLSVLTLMSMISFGQRSLKYQEFQFSLGTMNYSGEITSTYNPGTLLREMGPYASVDYTHYFGPKWGMGTRIGYGRTSASDLNHDQPDRGLSFTSDIVEWNGHIIYHFRRYGKYHRANRTTLYLKMSGGATWVHTTHPDDIQFPSDAELYPGTNGGFNLGLGGGLKWRLSNTSSLSIEFMGHYLYSDVLEGFKLANETNSTDGYGGIRIGYSYFFL